MLPHHDTPLETAVNYTSAYIYKGQRFLFKASEVAAISPIVTVAERFPCAALLKAPLLHRRMIERYDRLGKACIVIGHESRQQGVAFREGADPGQPQLLDQPILQRLVRPRDPALGLARIGADGVDGSEHAKRAQTGSSRRRRSHRSGCPEHPMLVAVECHGLAPGFKTPGFKIG